MVGRRGRYVALNQDAGTVLIILPVIVGSWVSPFVIVRVLEDRDAWK